jgi:hypothetical protein
MGSWLRGEKRGWLCRVFRRRDRRELAAALLPRGTSKCWTDGMEWAGWFRFGAGWGACHWSARQPEAGLAGQGRGADGETAFESWTDGMGWAGKLGTVGHISAYLMNLCIFDEFN